MKKNLKYLIMTLMIIFIGISGVKASVKGECYYSEKEDGNTTYISHCDYKINSTPLIGKALSKTKCYIRGIDKDDAVEGIPATLINFKNKAALSTDTFDIFKEGKCPKYLFYNESNVSGYQVYASDNASDATSLNSNPGGNWKTANFESDTKEDIEIPEFCNYRISGANIEINVFSNGESGIEIKNNKFEQSGKTYNVTENLDESDFYDEDGFFKCPSDDQIYCTGTYDKKSATGNIKIKSNSTNAVHCIDFAFEEIDAPPVEPYIPPEAGLGEGSSGCGIFGDKTLGMLKWASNIIRFGVPLIIILLGIKDFVMVIISGDDKNYKEAFNKLIKRLIIGVVILLIPYLIKFLFNLGGIIGLYNIGEDEIFCGIV